MTAGILRVFRGSKFFSNAGVGQISKNLIIEYQHKQEKYKVSDHLFFQSILFNKLNFPDRQSNTVMDKPFYLNDIIINFYLAFITNRFGLCKKIG